MEKLFTWIHLSDIHVGRGAVGGWDQPTVLAALRDDLADRAMAGFRPDAMFVTGDLVFAGSREHYQQAWRWLADVGQAVALSPERIFLVPGNRDLDRSADRDPDVLGLIEDLRAGAGLDDALAEPALRARLLRRRGPYLDFSSEFAPACLDAPGEVPDRGLFWHHRESHGRFTLRLIGLDTGLLCLDDDDPGRLEVGATQLDACLREPMAAGEVLFVLGHHPVGGGWLRDQRETVRWLGTHAHVYLFGHLHDRVAEAARGGIGQSFVQVAAGACYDPGGALFDARRAGSERLGGPPVGYGYGLGELLIDANGGLHLRLWPRVYTPERSGFAVDAKRVPLGQDYTEHALGLPLTELEPGAARTGLRRHSTERGRRAREPRQRPRSSPPPELGPASGPELHAGPEVRAELERALGLGPGLGPELRTEPEVRAELERELGLGPGSGPELRTEPEVRAELERELGLRPGAEPALHAPPEAPAASEREPGPAPAEPEREPRPARAQRTRETRAQRGSEARREARQATGLQAGDRLSERYVLLEELGRSRLAVVWRARDRSRRGDVAVKVLRPELAAVQAAREHFFAAARRMLELAHPGMVHIVEAEVSERGLDYFVMEMLEGGSLRHGVLKHRIRSEHTVSLILRVSEALIAGHDLGLVHRDIRPDNILLTAQGAPRLTDHDLAGVLDHAGGARSATVNTFLYSAPELVERPGAADVRADVYSLGMVAMFVLYGAELPMKALTARDRFLARLRCEPELRDILSRAVALEPSQRLANARALCDALYEIEALQEPELEVESAAPAARNLGETTAAMSEPAADEVEFELAVSEEEAEFELVVSEEEAEFELAADEHGLEFELVVRETAAPSPELTSLASSTGSESSTGEGAADFDVVVTDTALEFELSALLLGTAAGAPVGWEPRPAGASPAGPEPAGHWSLPTPTGGDPVSDDVAVDARGRAGSAAGAGEIAAGVTDVAGGAGEVAVDAAEAPGVADVVGAVGQNGVGTAESSGAVDATGAQASASDVVEAADSDAVATEAASGRTDATAAGAAMAPSGDAPAPSESAAGEAQPRHPRPVLGRSGLVGIPAGTFTMGSSDDDRVAFPREKPAHLVRVSAFRCMRTPVTRALWVEVMGRGREWWPPGPADDRPVNNVSWFDAVDFCNALSACEGLAPCYRIDGDDVKWLSSSGYRLPTEAEWEYACRAGSQSRWSFGDKRRAITNYAWFDKNASGPQPVGAKKPNRFGLCDMHGNVWEWCWDWYGPYPSPPRTLPRRNPRGPGEHEVARKFGTRLRTLRGGSFADGVMYLRSGLRSWGQPDHRFRNAGFRCVLGSPLQPRGAASG